MKPTSSKSPATGQPTQLAFRATASIECAAAAEGEAPKLPTFGIKGYTGVPMTLEGFRSPVIVDLNGLKASGGKIPALLNHDFAQIVGQTDAIKIDASGVDLSGVITGDDASARTVVTHARNGFNWQASIGADIVRQEFLKSGEKTTVNGREVSGPMLIAREARLREISFTPLGADDQTSAAVAASSSPGLPHGEPTMFEKWLEAKGLDPAALEDKVKGVLRASYDAEQVTFEKKTEAPASFDAIVSRHEAEIERQGKIAAFLDGAMADNPHLVAELKKLGQVALESKATLAEVELQAMRLERKRGIGARLVRDGRKVAGKVLEATVCRTLGMRNLDKQFSEQELNASDDQYPHGIKLSELLLTAARENGYSGFGTSDVRSLLRAAFAGQSRPDIRAEAEFSTLSLPGIMSNVANKFLLQGFNGVEAGWRDVSDIASARDFKTFYSYNFIMDAAYEKVGPTGELAHATASELEYTNRVETYGKMFAVTRTDIVNDDLSALSRVPMKLGRGAAIALNTVFWTEFLADAGSFYTSGHKNVSTGAGSALSSAGLQAAQLAFRKQTDPKGDPLAVEPRILLVPAELEITANELMTSLIINTGGSSTETKVPNRNVWANKYRTVVSSYLSNANITGYSTAAWYLIADPMDLPLIQVAFLNGRQEPIVESAEAEFNSLGVQFRGYYDFGVKKQEYRAAVRSAGS